jgi:hypothetical protein
MATIKYEELAAKVLKESKQAMTPEEIWLFAKSKGYTKNLAHRGDEPPKAPWRIIATVLYRSMDEKDSPFFKVDSRPKRFTLKELETTAKESKSERPVRETKFKEKDLHPLLTYFSHYHMDKIYAKTINHEKSKKKTYAEWVHPDVVGVSFPSFEYKPDVIELGTSLGMQVTKLYSFEIKKSLDFDTLREYYFQAVSNSSWAHEGYLVAAEIQQDDDFMTELKRLSAAFGIGIIALNTAEPDDSEIILAARTKSEIDWDTLNKLAELNPDVATFLTRIKKDLQTKEVRKEEFDKILSPEDLIIKYGS